LEGGDHGLFESTAQHLPAETTEHVNQANWMPGCDLCHACPKTNPEHFCYTNLTAAYVLMLKH